ncbi:MULTISPECIES: ShlB/FhaC/HecB family hemolysin secretion/activation protein [unclassified Janthinobacterium]|uniref:ShlB/FhaC/HecB family hemolysin secretion/activation protein n=1 Tax=unclassified Janthinobacterium TaxID=2610881 RepID=UPI00034A313D|nr:MULTISPECIES: ShlB/FhaC/HecB family hemolysin secretion/activation protein [unclassified Janthinobacterium]MEC5161384.1 hemolysin activation/secretion protein [Janthinobacterium sp. CG_S6]
MKHRLLRLLAGSVLSVAAAAACGADDAAAAALRFDISRFDVSGNSLLDPAEVARVLAPFAGKQRDFGDIQRALEALEAAFHQRGYSVVQVELPEQELNRDVVLLRVVENRIGRVSVSGNRHVDEANVRRALPALVEGRTPNMAALSTGLRLANDNPARKITLKLQSGEASGEVDAALEVADERPWKVSANLDNAGTEQTGKNHLGVVLQHANLWGRDHVLSLQYTTSVQEPSRVAVYGLGYHLPLYARGDSIDLFASYSNVDSGSVAAGIFDLAVSGKGAVAGARYNQYLARADKHEGKLVYGVDFKAYKNNVELQGLGLQLGRDVTVHPLSVAYLGSWTLERGEANLAVTLLRNVAGGAHGAQKDFDAARSGARANYRALRLASSLSRLLPGDWQARAVVNGQYTPDALVPGEQFGAGGAGSVRGFAERALSDDAGVAANLELYTPNWCGGARWQCRALAFYDAAHLWRRHALAGEAGGNGIGSAGLGLRVQFADMASLQLDYGHVLRAASAAPADGNRLHLRLALSY